MQVQCTAGRTQVDMHACVYTLVKQIYLYMHRLVKQLYAIMYSIRWRDSHACRRVIDVPTCREIMYKIERSTYLQMCMHACTVEDTQSIYACMQKIHTVYIIMHVEEKQFACMQAREIAICMYACMYKMKRQLQYACRQLCMHLCIRWRERELKLHLEDGQICICVYRQKIDMHA